MYAIDTEYARSVLTTHSVAARCCLLLVTRTTHTHLHTAYESQSPIHVEYKLYFISTVFHFISSPIGSQAKHQIAPAIDSMHNQSIFHRTNFHLKRIN